MEEFIAEHPQLWHEDIGEDDGVQDNPEVNR
jgi:hypothetical protein